MWQNGYLIETTQGHEAELPLGEGACVEGRSTSLGQQTTDSGVNLRENT